MSSLVPDTHMSSSSVETEIIAATAAVDIAIDEVQQRDDDLYDYNRELGRERHERRIARLALRDHISENGFALRKALKNESIKGYFPSPLQMEEMSIEDITTEIPVEDLRYVGSIKDRIYMPAFFSIVGPPHYKSAQSTRAIPEWKIAWGHGSGNACLHFRPIGHGFKQTRQHQHG